MAEWAKERTAKLQTQAVFSTGRMIIRKQAPVLHNQRHLIGNIVLALPRDYIVIQKCLAFLVSYPSYILTYAKKYLLLCEG